MKKVSIAELLKLYGGATANLPCADELQDEAGEHFGDTDHDWDDWADRFEKCVNGH